MNRDEEILMFRQKQIKSVHTKSLRARLTEGLLSAVLLLAAIGMIYWGYHSLEIYMAGLGE